MTVRSDWRDILGVSWDLMDCKAAVAWVLQIPVAEVTWGSTRWRRLGSSSPEVALTTLGDVCVGWDDEHGVWHVAVLVDEVSRAVLSSGHGRGVYTAPARTLRRLGRLSCWRGAGTPQARTRPPVGQGAADGTDTQHAASQGAQGAADASRGGDPARRPSILPLEPLPGGRLPAAMRRPSASMDRARARQRERLRRLVEARA